jgi:hypothetical protein
VREGKGVGPVEGILGRKLGWAGDQKKKGKGCSRSREVSLKVDNRLLDF